MWDCITNVSCTRDKKEMGNVTHFSTLDQNWMSHLKIVMVEICFMYVDSKPGIECLSLISKRWTGLSPLDVPKNNVNSLFDKLFSKSNNGFYCISSMSG